jgi:carotenoid cleavage dioxygenase-like enzyme
VIEIVRYADFQTNLFLKDVASGQTQRSIAGQLWQLVLDPQQQKIISNTCVVEHGCEFPVPTAVGQPGRYTYLSVQKQNLDITAEILGDVARYDYQTNSLTITKLPHHLYASEPIGVNNWVLATVYDGQQHCSEVWIWNGDHLADEPVCCLQLPSVIPIGFHGTWRST